MDAFSEVLTGVRLKGALFFRAEFSSPWGFSSPHSRDLAVTLAPGAAHLIIYHLVVAGSARAETPGVPALDLQAGDVVVIPHGRPHVLSGGVDRTSVDFDAIMRKIVNRDLSLMRAGGGGDRTEIVCGYMACDPVLCGPILESLPPILKVNIHTDRAGDWLERSILHMADESTTNQPGSDVLLAKLSEALFVDTLRRYVAGIDGEATGWLAGARDPIVGKSLALLHARPHHAWTIAGLATEVGLSRSALAERFTRYLSESPMAYLTGWRLRLAADALISTPKGVAEIAADVGYESEAAFNRAFKRMFGLPPARYRRERRSATHLPGPIASAAGGHAA